jgi:hypothetical protein
MGYTPASFTTRSGASATTSGTGAASGLTTERFASRLARRLQGARDVESRLGIFKTGGIDA